MGEWHYDGCEIMASGNAVLALGPATGHFIKPIAFCENAETALIIRDALRLASTDKEGE